MSNGNNNIDTQALLPLLPSEIEAKRIIHTTRTTTHALIYTQVASAKKKMKRFSHFSRGKVGESEKRRERRSGGGE